MFKKILICIGDVIINNRNRKKNIQFTNAVEKRKIQEHKKTNIKNKKRADVFIMFMLTVFTIYLGIYLHQYNKSPVLEITKVEKGIMDLTNLETGIMVRSETVYKNNEPGAVIYKYQNNEKVGYDDEIVIITDDTGLQSNNINVGNSNILDYEENYLLYENEVNTINKNIKKYIDNADIDNFRELYLMKNYIENEISERNKYLVNSNNDDVNFTVKESMKSEKSGILSYNVDGYEDIITYDKLGDITEKYTSMQQSKNSFQSKKSVINGEEIYKIIDSNTWYIVSYIENDSLEDISAGKYHKLYLNNGVEYIDIWFYIESIEKGEKTSKVVFKTTKKMVDFLEYRNIEFKLYNEVYEGLKIPTSAILEKEFIEIKLDYVYQDDGFYIIKEINEENEMQVPITVSLTDTEKGVAYLRPEENQNINIGEILKNVEIDEVYQIQKLVTLNGVLKVNNGFAEFKPIVLEEKIPLENEVTILNTKKNKYIKEYDKIVTVSDTINEGDRISR